MTESTIGHEPVLLNQVLELLAPQAGESIVDCTLGRGGHAAAILPHIPGGHYLGIDTDAQNAAFAEQRLKPIAEQHSVKLTVVHANFADIVNVLRQVELDHIDMLLADLGFASNQVDDADRGLSFREDGPLDMRLDQSAGVPASDLVNGLSERELADLIYELGEDRLSRRIARKIVEARGQSPILSTAALADVVRRACPRPSGGQRGRSIDPATRTFQALRIAVNGELVALDGLLRQLPQVLGQGGRAGIISFHSLEDRPVKQAFLKLQQEDKAQRLTRKPITADLDETARNPRSRSAKLRGIRRL